MTIVKALKLLKVRPKGRMGERGQNIRSVNFKRNEIMTTESETTILFLRTVPYISFVGDKAFFYQGRKRANGKKNKMIHLDKLYFTISRYSSMNQRY